MIMNSITMSKESEDKSGQSVKYEAYDPNQEVRGSHKGVSSDSYKKWGHLNFSKEDTSNKNTIEEGTYSQKRARKLDDKQSSNTVFLSNKSPVSIANRVTSSAEKSIPFHF